MATTTATQIQQLYVGLLGRAADQGGLNWWADQVTTGGKTLEDVRASFVTSTEYTTTYGAAATRADLVTSIYQNLFERTPSADEVKYWAETDTRPADQLVAAFIEFAGAADQAVINNKTFVAQTYTDTVGDANFDKAGAAAAIADVDGTAASVATATAAIANGTLAGQVPAVGLINAVAAANAAVTAYEKTAAGTNPTFDTDRSGTVTKAEADQALASAKAAHGSTSTVSLEAAQTDRINETAEAKTALLAVANATQKAAITAYDNAVAGQAALVLTPEQKIAADAAAAAAQKGVDGSVTSTSAVTYASLKASATINGVVPTGTALATITAINSGEKLYDALASENLSAAQHAALAVEAAKIPTYGSALVSSAEKELAVAKAATAVSVAKSDVNAIDSDGPTVPGTPPTGTLHEGSDYTAAVEAQTSATAALTAAKTADINVAAAKSVVDQFTALNKTASDATTAINTFNSDHSDKVAITKLNASVDATAKQDVFYFPAKVSAATDITIGGTAVAFGAGDAIVLGSGYTFNSGALTTGNNSALEVFFVKGATGTQVVIETNAVGSATTVLDAAGNVTAAGSPDAAVINLVGVTADHLSFANGVVSYV